MRVCTVLCFRCTCRINKKLPSRTGKKSGDFKKNVKGIFGMLDREQRVAELVRQIEEFDNTKGLTFGGLKNILFNNRYYSTWDDIRIGFMDIRDCKTDDFLCKIKFSYDYCCAGENANCENMSRCEEDGEFFWNDRCNCLYRYIRVVEVITDEDAFTPCESELYDILSDRYYSMNEINEFMLTHDYDYISDCSYDVCEDAGENGYVEYRVRNYDSEGMFSAYKYVVRVNYSVADIYDNIEDNADRNELKNLDITSVN